MKLIGELDYRWWLIKLWFRGLPEKLARKAAWWLPREVALWAFIRVCSATGDGPSDITYESAYKGWEAGAGK